MNITYNKRAFIMNELREKISKRLSGFESTPFLFVGSGLSRRYLGLDGWEGLLRKFAQLAINDEFAYEIFREQAKNEGIKDNTELFPRIAGLIESKFNMIWLKDKNFAKNRSIYGNLVRTGISPFKIELGNYFKSIKIDFSDNSIKREIDVLRRVGEKSLSGLITTNYDLLLETVLPSFTTYTGQDEILFSKTHSVAELFKIHGCCEKPNSLVITDSDYNNFNAKNAYLASKLLTIFIDHPVIFIGYSLNDANIEDILKSIIFCLSDDKLEILKNRLFFVQLNRGDSVDNEIIPINKSFEAGRSITMTKIFIDDFNILYHALLKNKAKYNPRILRQLKDDLYRLILTNDPKNKLSVANIDDTTKIEELDWVLGVGVSGKLSKVGYEAPTAIDLFLDIIYDNGNFDNTLLIEKTLPTLGKSHSNSLPIHKYLVGYNKEIPLSVNLIYKESFDDYLSKTIKKNKNRSDIEPDEQISSLRKKYEDLRSIELLPYLKEENIDTTQLYCLLLDILDDNPNILNDGKSNEKTNLRRAIKIYDWKRYYVQNKKCL